MASDEDFEFQLRAEKEFQKGTPQLQAGDKQTYVDPTDGTVYEWDQEKRGWFPMVSGIS